MPPLNRVLKLVAAGAVLAPASIYGGVSLKEYFLAKELKGRLSQDVVQDQATMARIVQLARERQDLIAERNTIDTKILIVEQRLEDQRQAASS